MKSLKLSYKLWFTAYFFRIDASSQHKITGFCRFLTPLKFMERSLEFPWTILEFCHGIFVVTPLVGADVCMGCFRVHCQKRRLFWGHFVKRGCFREHFVLNRGFRDANPQYLVRVTTSWKNPWNPWISDQPLKSLKSPWILVKFLEDPWKIF